MKPFVRTTLRTLRATLVSVSLLVLLALWGLRSEWAQNRLRPLVEQLVSNALGVAVKVGHVDIDLPAYAVLTDLEMRDAQQQPMFALKRVKLGFGSYSLFHFLLHPREVQAIRISNVQLIQPEAHFYRSRRDSAWNFDCLASENPDTTPSKPVRLLLGFPAVEIRGGEFSMVDSTRPDAALKVGERMNFSNLHLRDIHGDFSFHFEPEQNMYGRVSNFGLVEANSRQAIDQLHTGYLIQLKPKSPSRLSICLDGARIQAGRTHLDMDAELEDIRPDSGGGGFHPVFSAHFRPSEFDFQTLDKLLPRPLPMAEPIHIQGYLWGDLEGIYSDSLFVGMMDHTRLKTTLALTQFTDVEQLRFSCGIDHGTLSFEELKRLLPGIDIPLSGIVAMKGPVTGSLDQLRSQRLEVYYLDHTHLLVNARVMDYTRGDDIFMDIKFQDSQFRFGEIKRLLPSMNLPEWLSRFGTCGINGKFLGGINDFVVNADMTSGYGSVSSNLHLKLPPKARDITYEGWVSTQNIDFVALQADLPVALSAFNFEGKVAGMGTTWGKIVADVDGKLHQTVIEGHLIDGVATKDVKINGYKITGAVDVVDRQGAASVTVDLDMPDSSQHFFIVGDVKRLDLAHYDIVPGDSVFLSAIVNINLDGKEVEDYTGKMRFLQASLTRKASKDSLSLNNLLLTSKLDGRGRHTIKLRSSVADMDLVGRFKYENAIAVMEDLAQEAQLYVKNKDSLTTAYYAQKSIDTTVMRFRDTIRTKAELNHALAFFQVPLYLEPGTEIRVRFRHGYTDELEVNVQADSIAVSSVGMRGDSIFVSIHKDGMRNSLLGEGFFLVKKLALSKGLHFENVSFTPNADDNQVDYFLRATQPETGSDYVISAQTIFKAGGEIRSTINDRESHLKIRGQTWLFGKGNSITHLYEKPPSLARISTDSVISRYHLQGFKLRSEGQEIAMGGIISKDAKDLMNVDIRNLDIRNVLEILDNPADIGGNLKRATFGAWNLLSGQPSIMGGGEVVNFRYEQVDSIGMRFNMAWPIPLMKSLDYAGARVVLGHWGQDSVITKGWYNVKNDSLHFDTDSSSIQLAWVEPFVEGILSEMKGRVALDHFKVRGTVGKPELDGIARFTNASFKVDYLNNVFRIGDNQLKFDNRRINVSRIVVQDTLRGSAEMNGYVWYNDTSGIKLDIKVSNMDNLLFMDTRKQDNEVFYGRIVLDGDSAQVTGLATAPDIEAWVNTGNGSWLDIPISDYTSANRLDFVNFIQKGDTLRTVKRTDFGGMKMTLNVNARKNARVRLIFDEFVGDIIEARGDGNIIVKVDEAGEFNMFGAFVVDQGDYHFTMENVLNKKFVVNRGGRITWNGDPYDALLDMDAIYKVNADMSAILGSSSSGNRVPVEIVMHMKGSLMAPEITLELRLEMSEQDVFGLATFFQGVQYDQQELNKQVVSLLMFKRFTSTANGPTTGGSAANVTSSISELVSNQVNHWLSQTFSDPKLGVEVNSNEFQDVQLALKASLFNDRVTVERNGTLIGNSSGNLSIGDLIVLIKVLPKPDTTGSQDPNAGQLVMEIFNREDASITNTYNVTRGSGLFYKKDFDRLKDIFDRRNRNMRKEEGVQLQ